MVIRASSSKQIATLIAELSDDSAVKRETAIARLTVIGGRAVDPLIALAVSSAPPAARVAAFRALEAIGDSHALDPALRALNDADVDVAAAAAGVARVFVTTDRGAAAVDRLSAVATDSRRPDAIRLAALRALRDLDRKTVAPLLRTLKDDPSSAVRNAASGKSGSTEDVRELLTAAAAGTLPDDAEVLRAAIAQAGRGATLEQLRQVVDHIREREGAMTSAKRDAWTAARAAAHVALAERGSRIALYDVRESIESAKKPLPVEFLRALTLVGDASCLAAIASAHDRAKDAWWRQHLTDAFYAIVTRERLTARSAVLKRIANKPTRPT